MKVTIKIPLPEQGKFTEVVADGKPTEIAEFMKLWLMGGAVPKLSEKSPITV